MKTTLAAALILGTLSLVSCADKMTDQQSNMQGGGQNVTQLKDTTPANSDGIGRPVAGGKTTSQADTMWNQSSAASGKPF
jgi:hypothetical protein